MTLTLNDKLSTNGTSFHDAYLDIKYDELVLIIGKDNCDNFDDYKCDAEWVGEINGETFTIYNYKNGRNYCGDSYPEKEGITDWHIGGRNKEETFLVKDYIEKRQKLIEREDVDCAQCGYEFEYIYINDAEDLCECPRCLEREERDEVEQQRLNDKAFLTNIKHPESKNIYNAASKLADKVCDFMHANQDVKDTTKAICDRMGISVDSHAGLDVYDVILESAVKQI